jgi:hypothetical protein
VFTALQQHQVLQPSKASNGAPRLRPFVQRALSLGRGEECNCKAREQQNQDTNTQKRIASDCKRLLLARCCTYVSLFIVSFLPLFAQAYCPDCVICSSICALMCCVCAQACYFAAITTSPEDSHQHDLSALCQCAVAFANGLRV